MTALLLSLSKKPIDLMLCLALTLSGSAAFAHKASDSYLSLYIADGAIKGKWDIALRDLDYALGLDSNEDASITWGELRRKRGQVTAYAFARLKIGGSPGDCRLQPVGYQVDTHTDGAYSALSFEAFCPQPIRALAVDYALFFDLDPQHRGLVAVASASSTQTALLSPDHRQAVFNLADARPAEVIVRYLEEGVRHIWTGYDHVLFLLSLLLPAVFSRQGRSWHPADRLRPVLTEVVKIVTAFTIAHSLTLALAALAIISLPSRWVESAIAFSVIAAALNNLFPFITGRVWLVAFLFGLIHGLGFANVLKDLGLPQTLLAAALLAFNGGVELGQLAIVGVFLPMAFIGRKTFWYRTVFFRWGSTAIALTALIWLSERAFNLRFFD